MRRGHLTPDDLDREPQLAVLFALDAALWAARMGLISVHAELREPKDEPDTDTTTALARTLVLLLGDLDPVLSAYRHVLKRRTYRPLPFTNEAL